MAIKSSTGALSQEQHEAQNKCYAENHKYDYVIIGTGNSAITVGALLANAGHKICMLEYHDIPGGYMQNFKTGEYTFCAQVHYTWGCGPGGKIYEFLKRVGLEKDITFEAYDPDGYDRVTLPDGKNVFIPCGYDKLAENIDAAYPGQKKGVQKFCSILDAIRKELRHFPESNSPWWKYAIKAHKFLHLIKYRTKTLQDVFDECGLSKEAQAVLAADAGDFMEPPNRLSIFAFVGLFGGYNVGAYYPTKHYQYYVERLMKSITDHEGCHVYYENPVTKITTNGEKVTQVETKDGKKFTAKNFICNMDPHAAAEMIGMEKFPDAYQKRLDYEYSPSGMVIYLGLKPGFDLRDYGFGKFNTWHLQEWDMNKTWKDQLANDFSKCWFFLSTPTLHTDMPGTAPEGCQILEIATLTDYTSFKKAQDESYSAYMKKKLELANHLFDLIEKHYIPDLRKNIVVKTIGTTVTNEDFVMAPRGNAYGATMTPEQMSLGKLTSETPWNNFFWCNATSGFAGMYGTVSTGMSLYTELTGDKFYDPSKGPTDEEFIAGLKKN